jgi:hypothetical protein
MSGSIYDFIGIHYQAGYQVWDMNGSTVTDEGNKQGATRAAEDYPYMILRDVQAVTNLANTVFQQWEGRLYKPSASAIGDDKTILNVWTKNLPDTKRLFTSAFVRGYLDRVKKLDEVEAAKRQPPPPPQPAPTPAAPAAPSNTATLQGATITLK